MAGDADAGRRKDSEADKKKIKREGGRNLVETHSRRGWVGIEIARHGYRGTDEAGQGGTLWPFLSSSYHSVNRGVDRANLHSMNFLYHRPQCD